MKFAYADPPYHKMGAALYGDLHPEAAKWDDKRAHRELVARLVIEYPDGWALSCNPRDLRWLFAETPDDTRVAAYCKTYHQWRNVTTQYAWEPVLFRGGREALRRTPMVRDWWSGAVNHRSGLVGGKPAAFCRWVLDLIGYDPLEDTIDDLFPGTGIMGRVADQGTLALTELSEAER